MTGTGGQVLTNPSTFPLNTTNGGIDLIGYTGVVFQAIVPIVEVPSLLIPEGAEILLPDNLVVSTGNISVPGGTAALTDGSLSAPQD